MSILVTMFWVADVMNMPFMECFDTTYPLNSFFWFVVFILTTGTQTISVKLDK